jgi:hypothetical protein
MKKVFAICLLAGGLFVACGPSAEEKAKAEAEAQRIADSMMQAMEAENAAAEAAAAADTTAAPAEGAATTK